MVQAGWHCCRNTFRVAFDVIWWYLVWSMSDSVARLGIVAMFDGLKPVVIALVIVALQRVARRAVAADSRRRCGGCVRRDVLLCRRPRCRGGALVPLLWDSPLTAVRPVPFPPPRQSKRRRGRGELLHPPLFERDGKAHPPFSFVACGEVGCGCLLLWLLPLPLFYVFGGDFHFWRGLSCSSKCKTAFVTIGGSYTVIPYVAQVAVLQTSLAEQAPNDGRLRTRRDNSGPSYHRSCLCRIPGRVQPLPRLIVDGNLGSAGDDFELYLSAVLRSSYSRARRWWKSKPQDRARPSEASCILSPLSWSARS